MQMIRNRDDKDITTKIYMQQEALNSMPENSEMLMNALEIDDTPPPSDRPWYVIVILIVRGAIASLCLEDYISILC